MTPPAPSHGLGCDRGHVLRPGCKDLVLDGFRGTKPEGFEALAVAPFPVPVGIHGVAEALVHRVAVLVHMRHATHGAGRDGRAVIGVLAADDDAPLRLALQHQ